MTTTSAPTHDPADLRLGRDVVRRMRLPGPPVGRPLPSRIGSLASSVSRFAAATSRPVDVRRALVGPDPRGLGGSSAPPRWWTPVEAEPEVPPAAPDAGSATGSDAVRRTTGAPAWLAPARPVALRRLPERSLPRAAREVPNETSWTPGGIVGGLRGEVARIRRLDEVTAVGPMLTQNDRTKLNAGLAARNVQQAAAQQATSQPAVARRATTRTPRQPAAAASAPSASEPPTAPRASAPPGGMPGGGASATVSAAPAAGSVAHSPPTGSAAAVPPGGGAPATVSATPAAGSVAHSPPTGSAAAVPPGGGAPATVSAAPAAGSVAHSPPAGSAGPAPSPTPLRRVARPSWQLRSQQSRFDGLVRRTPIGHHAASSLTSPGSAPSAPASAPVGLASVVARLASPERVRPAASVGSRSTTLESSVRGSEVVAAAGPSLIAGSIDAPATVRRHAWSAGSLVMRQSAGARSESAMLGGGRAAAGVATAIPSARTATARPPAAGLAGAAPAPDSPSASSAAASTPVGSSPAASAPTGPASSDAPAPVAAPAARTAEPVVRRLPSAVAPAHGPAAATTSDAAAGTATSGGSGTVSATGTVPHAPTSGAAGAADSPQASTGPAQLGLRRLWRRATDVRPATDVRTSTPAPVVRLTSDPAAVPAGTSPTGSAPSPTVRRLVNPPSTPAVPDRPAAAAAPASPASQANATPTQAPTQTPAAPSTPTPAVRRTSFPVSRVGAHVARPGIAGAEVGMPELMTIRRATAHGTDANRTLATGFGAPQTIRPAGSPVAAPIAAVAGESRLWRTVTPTGAVRTFGASVSPAAASLVSAMPVSRSASATAPAAARAGAPGQTTPPGRAPAQGTAQAQAQARARAASGSSPRFAGTAPAAPVRRTWQPWSDSPTPAGLTSSPSGAPITTFPAGPPGAASAPSGRTPAADVRRLTVAPPRISVAPSQPPPPPVPEVARTAPAALQRTTAPAATGRPSNTASSSLVESTAHLFATPDAPLIRRAVQPGGSSMSSLTPPSSGSPTIRRRYGDDSSGGDMSDQTMSAEATDRLVDKVVERIERRVVEELERRGRSRGRGGY